MEKNAAPQLDSREPTKTFKVLSLILGAMLALFFALMFFFNFQDAGLFRLLLVFFTTVSGTALLCASRLLDGISWSRRMQLVVLVGVILLLLAVQVQLAKAFYGTLAYDFNYIYVAGRNLDTLGGCEEYFARFPNNILMVLVFAVITRFCSLLGVANTMMALVAFNLLVVDLSILLACLCAKKAFGKKASVLTLLFCVPLIGLHYGIVCPYSDTFAMFFSILFLFLYLYMPKGRAAAMAVTALMAAVTVVGFKIKPQVVIVAVAVAMTEFFYHRLDKNRLLLMGKRFLCFVAAGVISMAGLNAVITGTTGHILTPELREAKEASFTHYLMMGLNPETHGFFSSEDWAATNGIDGKEGKTAYNLQVVGERLSDLGVIGYGKFLLHKARLIFHNIRLDMWVREPFASQDAVSVALQNSICQGGKGFPVYNIFLQSLWVILFLLWILPVIFRQKEGFQKPVAILRLNIMGLTLFSLLFEGGPRYLFHQFPLFILLAVWGMQVLPGSISAAWRTGKKRLTAWRNAHKGNAETIG